MADQNQITPDTIRALLASFLSGGPQYNAKGQVKPQGLDYQQALLNFQQDQQKSIADPIQGYIAGGQGSFDPSVFQDVPGSKVEKYQVPQDPLAPYQNLDPNSVEYGIALAIKNGKSPEQVVQDLQSKKIIDVAADPKAADRVRSLAQDLFKGNHDYNTQMSQLPDTQKDPQTGQWQYTGSGKIAGGQLQVPVMEKSPAAKAFEAAGLPTPDKQFSQADWQNSSGSDYQAKVQELAKLQAQSDKSKGAWQQQLAVAPNYAPNADRYDALMNQAAQTPDTPAEPGHLKGGLVNSLKHAFLGAPETYTIPASTQQTRANDVQAVVDPFALAAGRASQQLLKDPQSGAAHDQYNKDSLAAALARKQAEQLQFSSKANDAYSAQMADNFQKAGLSPTMLALLQRARGLGG